jgi:hypothetical protein
MIIYVKNSMITIFTFPYKNPTTLNVKELKKTCLYLGLDYTDKNKKELVDMVLPYQYKDKIPYRTQIKYSNNNYYINDIYHYKSFTRTYENVYTETYEILRSRYKYPTIYYYDKQSRKWYLDKNIKPIGSSYIQTFDIFRQAYLFLDYQDLYIKYLWLLQNNIIIKDIFTYLITIATKMHDLQTSFYIL